MDANWQSVAAFIAALFHLIVPIMGLLWIATVRERQRIQAEKKELAKLLIMAARGRRYR